MRLQEKKKELQLVFEEKERKARRKIVGNCRFIGELFKFKMLTPKIMLNYIRELISQLEEQSLECLYTLLTTIGRDLDEKVTFNNSIILLFLYGSFLTFIDGIESVICRFVLQAPKEVDLFFKRLQEIVDPTKNEKISSRIRFMILDVIDLRKNRWVPRRETDNPKTIDQMNMEMEKKELEQRLSNMTLTKSYNGHSRSRKTQENRKYLTYCFIFLFTYCRTGLKTEFIGSEKYLPFRQ